jgi:DNA repair photolyase
VLVASATPFSIVTKGPMVVRDLDILRRATAGAGARVYLSVPTANREAWAKLEPGTAEPAQRLRAVRILSDAGIEAGVLMMPLVPGISTSRAIITETMQAFAAAGVRWIGCNVAHLEPGVREHFFAFLDREFPSLSAGYRRLYSGAYAPREYVSAIESLVREAASTEGVERGAR